MEIINTRKYRMYGLVAYQLSNTIHAGIQFGHAVVEYANYHFHDVDYTRWAQEDKTFIILNGGTTNKSETNPGTLNQQLPILVDHVKFATFYEPDLGDQLTAIVFLVDDRVWDRENWPDYQPTLEEAKKQKEMIKNSPDDKEQILESFESYRIWFNNFSDLYYQAQTIVWLRDYLKNFRLA